MGGYTFSDELKKKLSDAHKGVKLSEEHRRSLSKSLMGRIETTNPMFFFFD
ncbi:hypothetical protein LIT25_18630 [Bacillus sp. F19]|nr:hypothetical protein LIT25_18630 [Bacillus sp. F19]